MSQVRHWRHWKPTRWTRYVTGAGVTDMTGLRRWTGNRTAARPVGHGRAAMIMPVGAAYQRRLVVQPRPARSRPRHARRADPPSLPGHWRVSCPLMRTFAV